jgi:hypothetical protein
MPEVGIKPSLDFNSLTVKVVRGMSTPMNWAAFSPSWFPIPASLIVIGNHASFSPSWFPIPASLIVIGNHASFSPRIPIGLRSDLSLFLTFSRSSLQILFGDNYQQNSTELLIILESLPIKNKLKSQYLLSGILFNALSAFIGSLSVKVTLWDTKIIKESGISIRYAAIIVEVSEESND